MDPLAAFFKPTALHLHTNKNLCMIVSREDAPEMPVKVEKPPSISDWRIARRDAVMISVYTYIVQVEPGSEPFASLSGYDCKIILKETTAEAKTYTITSVLDISSLLDVEPSVMGYTAIHVISVKKIK